MQFLKVDVDAVPEVAQLFRVSAMPTFVILQGSNKVEEMKGADPARLEAMVRKHATVGSSVSSSGGSSSTTVVEKGLEGFVRSPSVSRHSCIPRTDPDMMMTWLGSFERVYRRSAVLLLE